MPLNCYLYKYYCNFTGPIPKGWQRNGEIEFQNVSIQHKENGAPVLKNINFTIKPGQKVRIENYTFIYSIHSY